MPGATPIVVVLAGGSNSRFWPLRAKSLFTFGGRTLLERHVAGFLAAGCRRFVVVANGETVDDVRRAVAALPADIAVAVQAQPRGMGDAVLTAAGLAPELKREPFIVTQAHDVVDPSLYVRFVAAADAAGVDGLIAGQRVAEYFPGAYLTLEGERVAGMVEKPPPGSEPSDLVSLVLHLHRRPGELLDRIRAAYADPTAADDHYERAIAALLPTSRYLLVPYDGPW